ncbi:hypothetical protein FYJ27_11220 [Anaerosalibacter bizertensis]|uniref:Uncharacterized protein n=1 Tax=Anaerosalibacter bizertensis TaxID=932217 RepID=A0A844FJW0_9FIRM|nr:hypothetical protein [Anaerosalibacter bizertensis]MSS44269.1 hypothetical protein [Anaerosalibacter bizertensis]
MSLINFREYSELINQIGKQLEETLIPITIAQNQMEQAFKPFINFQDRMAETLVPIINIQKNISKMFEPIYSIFEKYNDMIQVFSDNILKSIQAQQDILIDIMDIDPKLMVKSVSDESSKAITQISSETINKFDFYDYPEEISESRETAIEISRQKSQLTWEQIMTIITFIITVIMFIQAQMPNKQLTNLEDSVQQLIEIEIEELNILKKQLDE